jgi:hypothetical protein
MSTKKKTETPPVDLTLPPAPTPSGKGSRPRKPAGPQVYAVECHYLDGTVKTVACDSFPSAEAAIESVTGKYTARVVDALEALKIGKQLATQYVGGGTVTLSGTMGSDFIPG